MPKIFGFGHRSRMGKNTVANFLAGYIRQNTRNKSVIVTSFASKLKSMCHDLYGWAGLMDEAFYEQDCNANLRDVKLYPIGKTPVEIWIEFGTTVGRSIYMDTWLEYTLNKKCDYLIITDVRFPNELHGIHQRDGRTYKVVNPRVPLRDSVADNALEGSSGWTATLINDSNLKDLNLLTIKVFKDLI